MNAADVHAEVQAKALCVIQFTKIVRTKVLAGAVSAVAFASLPGFPCRCLKLSKVLSACQLDNVCSASHHGGRLCATGAGPWLARDRGIVASDRAGSRKPG